MVKVIHVFYKNKMIEYVCENVENQIMSVKQNLMRVFKIYVDLDQLIFCEAKGFKNSKDEKQIATIIENSPKMDVYCLLMENKYELIQFRKHHQSQFLNSIMKSSSQATGLQQNRLDKLKVFKSQQFLDEKKQQKPKEFEKCFKKKVEAFSKHEQQLPKSNKFGIKIRKCAEPISKHEQQLPKSNKSGIKMRRSATTQKAKQSSLTEPVSKKIIIKSSAKLINETKQEKPKKSYLEYHIKQELIELLQKKKKQIKLKKKPVIKTTTTHHSNYQQ